MTCCFTGWHRKVVWQIEWRQNISRRSVYCGQEWPSWSTPFTWTTFGKSRCILKWPSSVYKNHGCCSVWKLFICDFSIFSEHLLWMESRYALERQQWAENPKPLLSQLGFCHAVKALVKGRDLKERSKELWDWAMSQGRTGQKMLHGRNELEHARKKEVIPVPGE